MDDAFRVETDGVVYLELGSVVAVRARAQPAPPGFEATSVLETGGTIFPGLIELHNHLSYNALPLWNVPKRYDHRGQWPNHPDYRKLISGPMTVIGELKNADGTSPLLPALIRFVECKCLLGGVTTSQGMKLASNAGHPALLPRARPQRRADRRQGPARGAGPHPRHRGQGRGLVPRTAPEGGQLPAAAPRRGRDRPRPCAGLHRAAPLRRAADLADRVGARRALHRHPLRGPAARGLRRARVAPLARSSGRRSATCCSTAAPPASRRPRRRGSRSASAATGRRAAARTCWAS